MRAWLFFTDTRTRFEKDSDVLPIYLFRKYKYDIKQIKQFSQWKSTFSFQLLSFSGTTSLYSNHFNFSERENFISPKFFEKCIFSGDELTGAFRALNDCWFQTPLVFLVYVSELECTKAQLIFVPAACQRDTVSKQSLADWQPFRSTEYSKDGANWTQKQHT